MQSRNDAVKHISSFQEAYRHLTNSKFIIPEFSAAGLLLSTLYKDPTDRNSWDFFIKSMRITEATTLSSITNLILDEKRRQNSTTTTSKTALAAKERTAC